MKYPLFAALGLAFTSLAAQAGVNCAVDASAVAPQPVAMAANSRTNPLINQRHLFCGEINKRGKAVGLHARPDGQDPVAGNQPAARILGGIKDQEPGGRYSGQQIQVRDPDSGRWVTKGPPSTFYPDHCSQAQVLASVRNAFKSGFEAGSRSEQFTGLSAPAAKQGAFCLDPDGQPFKIRGFVQRIGGQWMINTAYPLRD